MSKISLEENVEKELLNKIKKGDKESFGKIFEHYLPFIRNYFRQRWVEENNGDDLAATVFEKAMKGIDNFRWQGLSLSAWLYKIARNVLIDYFRESSRQNRRRVSLLHLSENTPAPCPNPEEEALRSDFGYVIKKLLEEMPERESKIIYLKFFEGYTNKDIAAHLGLSETNVSTIVHRVVSKLRESLLPERSQWR